MDPQVVSFVVVAGLTFVAIMLMWDISANARCARCSHCRDIETIERERAAERVHASYHSFRGERVEDCSDENCVGRR